MCISGLFCLLLYIPATRAQVVISEILINPPGTDTPNEYIELRGPPNQVLSSGTYFVAVEGDTNGNPGTIQNVFDLSGKALGGNGFLVLLQKTNSYIVNSNATVLLNTKGAGWGNALSSSVGHRGESGQTDLENGSATFFLIRSATPPAIGADIDVDDNGVPDGPYTAWTILDSVGILDDSGLGDIAYGLINFRRNAAATASGVIVSITFNPDYVGRSGNTTGSAATDWIASSSLGGAVPSLTLGSAGNTAPSTYGFGPLNHIGGPNFGAAGVPGLVSIQSGWSTDVNEGTGTDSYLLALNTTPSGAVSVQIDATGQVEISVNGGVSFGLSRSLTFNSTAPQTVTVRALADNTIDSSPHIVPIHHHITTTADTAHYPTTTVGPIVNVNVMERDTVLLSELKVNPPGTDEPYEFIEIKGPPNALLTNVYFLAIEGDTGGNPGTAKTVINLSSRRIGSSGLLIILANGSPYFVPSGATAVYDSHLNTVGGALGNGSVSFLLISSPLAITEGVDLDAGDKAVLDGLPVGALIMDSIAWTDGNTNDIVYGGAVLNLPGGRPEAATRFGWDNTPRSADAWFFGQLQGPSGSTLAYNENKVSPNFPSGTLLTPGIFQNSPPGAGKLMPICGVIGDSHNPTLTFRLVDADTPPAALSVAVSSSNWLVVPDSQLTLTPLGDGWFTLALNPLGVGYSLITLEVADDDSVGYSSFLYAASAAGRPGGSFHIGGSDGSTAIPIDSNWMLVADDENEVLRLYNRRESGYPVRQFDFISFLGLTDFAAGVPLEVDIEGSTRVGNRLFFMGSHSNSGDSQERPNRSRIFAVDVSGAGTNISLAYAGRYDYLKLDLISWDQNNGHGKGPDYYGLAASSDAGVDPKGTNGFNIEGLTMMAGSANSALIGFRAPIVAGATRTYALLIPVLNFAALAVSGAPPGSAVFGAPIELDLYGRGIRSIEGNVNGYIIVAGPPISLPDKYPMDFRLYTWSGDRNQNAQQRSADLSGLNPEGLVELPPAPWTASTAVQLVSDNGTTRYYGDQIEAKHLSVLNFKKCRSDFVPLGDVVKPEPIIVSSKVSPAGVTITWRSLKGEMYRLQYSYTLEPDDWANVAGDVSATGPYASTTDFQPGSPQCFYRVVVL
jgi:hypothetical protein